MERYHDKTLLQIRQLCESAIKWDEDPDNSTMTDRAWLAKVILDILRERTGT